MHLVEAHGCIHRYYHGFPPMERPSDNHPIGVVHGIATMLWKLSQEKPGYAAMVFDKGRSTARTKLDPCYKANRQPPDKNLTCQIPLARRTAEMFGFYVVESEGIEADDLIATYTRLAVEAGHEVTIVSPDKDLYQLIQDGVSIFDPRKNIPIGSDEVRLKFGVHPEQMIDFQAMCGDVSDNIKGIKNIGPKKAAALLDQFGSLEAILDNTHAIPQVGMRRNIEQDANRARLAKKMVTLDQCIPVTCGIDRFVYSGFDSGSVLAFLEEMELVTLRGEIEKSLAQAA